MNPIAQQLVDAAGKNGGGGLAFVLLVVMVCALWGSLFFMDRVRKQRGRDDRQG
jgi:hypothetical protein